jgi:hypothetical protein
LKPVFILKTTAKSDAASSEDRLIPPLACIPEAGGYLTAFQGLGDQQNRAGKPAPLPEDYPRFTLMSGIKMRLTQWSDFSQRVLMYCADAAGREVQVTVSEIARAHDISRAHPKTVAPSGRSGFYATSICEMNAIAAPRAAPARTSLG